MGGGGGEVGGGDSDGDKVSGAGGKGWGVVPMEWRGRLDGCGGQGVVIIDGDMPESGGGAGGDDDSGGEQQRSGLHEGRDGGVVPRGGKADGGEAEYGAGGGGTEVTLVGDGMVRGGVHSRCRFGAGEDREGRARWETSTAVACTTPGSGGLVGNVTVELVGEEGRASGSNGVRYEYRREGGIAVGDGRAGRPEVRVDGMRPSFGRVTGGTMVTLTGRGLMWEGMGVFGCRFGSAASVAAHSTSSSMVQCVTPEAVEGGKVSMVLEEDGERVWEGARRMRTRRRRACTESDRCLDRRWRGTM